MRIRPLLTAAALAAGLLAAPGLATAAAADAGHTPEQAEGLVRGIPVWKSAPDAAVTGLAALRAVFCSHMAASGPQHLRARRERTAAACRAWLEYRLP